jgi:UrcA family protein
MNRLTTLIVFGSLTLTQQLALAGAPQDPPTMTVRYADLDLTKPAGAKALYVRVTQAARDVCSPLDGRDVARASRYKACVQKSTSDAVTKIDRPQLTAYAKEIAGAHGPVMQVARD